MTTQESQTVQELGEALVTLARMKASIGPLLLAARQKIKQWDEEYKATGRRQNLYWPLKNTIAPLDKLYSMVDNEFVLTMGTSLERYKDQVAAEAIAEYKARRKATKEESAQTEAVSRPIKRTKKPLRAS